MNDSDPFNCPDCGSHDYGLWAPQIGDCPWCLKRECARWKAAYDTAFKQAMDNGERVQRLELELKEALEEVKSLEISLQNADDYIYYQSGVDGR